MGLRLNMPKLKLIVHNLAESSRYVSKDPPKDLLELILQHGAEIDSVDKKLY